ncbi:hypothetical protein C8F01DRAFT_1307573 [Mycena amicta]|nr:hypothetical protein C8F01DRAFT_1307573 [Mycena amicta]
MTRNKPAPKKPAPKQPAPKKPRVEVPALDSGSDTEVETGTRKKPRKAAAKKAAAVPAVPMPDALKQNPFENKIYTTTMLNAIIDDEQYRAKLYPGSGPNLSTAAGGGSSKVTIYWELAKLLWGTDHAAFIAWLGTGKAKEREVITDKIKYRLSVLDKATRKIRDEMKQTGAGNSMTQEELDGLPEDDERRSAWGSKLADFPWYFEMDGLLGRRPNAQPVAVGNTASDDIIDVSDNDADTSDAPPGGMPDDTHDSDAERDAPGSDNDSSNSAEEGAAAGVKRKKKTGAQPSTSAPAQRSTAPVRKPKAHDVGAMVDQEAETHRQQLKLASLDTTADIERVRATKAIAQGRLELKRDKEKRKMEEEKRKTDDATFARKLEILKAEREFGIDAVRQMFPDHYKVHHQPSTSHQSSPGPSHHSFQSSDDALYPLGHFAGGETFDYSAHAGPSMQAAGSSGWYGAKA